MHNENMKRINRNTRILTRKSLPNEYIQSLQVFVVTISLLIITLSVNLQVPLYGTYAQAAGYGHGLVSLTFAAYVVGLLPVLIMLGGISDRIGYKSTMLLGLLAALFANVMIILDPTIQTLLIVRILQGIAVGLSLGAATAYIAEILENSTRAANIVGIVVAMGLGCGPLITSTSLLYNYTNIPYSYFGVVTFTMICSIIMIFMPKTRGSHSKQIIRLPVVSRNTIKYCVAIFLAWSLTGAIIATIPSELEHLNFNGWSGLLVFLAICTGVIFQPWVRRLSSKQSLTAGYSLLILAYVGLIIGVWFGSLVLILLASACSGASSFGFIYLGGLTAIIRSSMLEKARAVSGYFLFAYLGLGLPCIFIGYLADKSNLLSALVGFGGSIAALAVLLFIFITQNYKTISENN